MNQPVAQSKAPLFTETPAIGISKDNYPALDRWMSLNPGEFKRELDALASLRGSGTSPTVATSIRTAVEALATLYRNRKRV